MIVDDDDEAVRVANRGGYGLSAAIFTEDLRKGLSLARKLESRWAYSEFLHKRLLVKTTGLCTSTA
jgi:acyl-CoA reductase-like NAD-dependent aldehyde dehydrogenase